MEYAVAPDMAPKLLRGRLLRRKNLWREPAARWADVVTARALRACETEPCPQVRRGRLTRERLRSTVLDIDDCELLIGRLSGAPPRVSDAEVEESREYLKRMCPQPPGQTGHCELHFEPVMQRGIAGVAEDIRGRMTRGAGDAGVYQSFLDALEGLSALIENAAATVETAMNGADATRRNELAVLAASCRRIAHEPPQSFRDAIQLLWFVLLGVMCGDHVGLVVPGHLDRTLGRFYEADRERGALTREEALALIEGLYLLINEFIPDGLAMSVMVGGRDGQGRDATNEVSYLCLEALRRTALIYPTVGICWHEGTPQGLVDLAIDLIGHGNPNPAFFGDETIQTGLKALGVPPAQACHYINSTCVEITPATASNVWVASPYFSTCKILLEEIADEVESGTIADSFTAFRERYFARLDRQIEAAASNENAARRERQRCGRKPLQSVFTRDCIARGKDIDDGGALYNWVECSFVGLANLVDSLHVLRKEVFEAKRLSLAAVKAILDADFKGLEAERQRFLHGHPKYGQDRPEVDAGFGETVAFLREACARRRMEPDGSPFVPGAFCWIMHEMLGRECGATPDGRRAGFPFADGCGPAQGRETCGPTAAILSTTSWDHSPMLGGLAYNMKFNSAFFQSSKGYESLRTLVLTFLRRGGFETQINVVDGDTLKKAREDPEAYRDLVVRIGGYSDYFTRLSREMQDEIILRTEFTEV
jgi:formate C-acetyltransferase